MSDDRMLDTLQSIVRESLPTVRYFGVYEYRIASQSTLDAGGTGNTYDLVPTDLEIGIPQLPDVAVKPGLPGLTSSMQVGALVLVAFINGSSKLPFIQSVAGPDDPDFVPQKLTIDSVSQLTFGNSGTDVNVALANARVLRHGEAIRLNVAGAVVAGSPGAITNCIGTIEIAPTALLYGPGPAGLGYSKVKA